MKEFLRLNLNSDDRFKLLTYSVEWRKLRIYRQLEKHSLAIEKFYNKLLQGKSITTEVIRIIFEENSIIINEEQLIILANNLEKQIQKIYKQKLADIFRRLKLAKSPLTIKRQILKNYLYY